MFHPVVKISLLLYFTALLVSARNFADDPRNAVQGLHLESYNEEQVQGCYNYNKTLGICFDIQRHSFELLKTTGEQIFVNHDLGPDSFLYQVLDLTFLGIGSSIVYVPKDIPKVREELLAFLALKKAGPSSEQQKNEDFESMKAHYQEAMSELHYTPEMQLLELLPEALMDNSTQLEILKPFYTLCLSLLSRADVQTPAQLKATLRLHDHQRQKRCTNMKTVSWHRRNECRGMCGPTCTCWSLICGDCCYHQGCYEHDRCCDVKGFWDTYCLLPFMYSFSCSSYGAYPKCLY
ncbi:hypothetical protein OS493_005485 [Desmophyllum pertusum]|uniref:Uncharacterized protein n=1 Tax=Desmophyllum pertusum TaxID=174260 RepID=A0A9W9YV22_9CNID|nr:hypothetical protein OS493_005485 [Desmophyllum pertusum]